MILVDVKPSIETNPAFKKLFESDAGVYYEYFQGNLNMFKYRYLAYKRHDRPEVIYWEPPSPALKGKLVIKRKKK